MIAQSMIVEGMTNDTISRCTGMSFEEIDKHRVVRNNRTGIFKARILGIIILFYF
jgi:hypothetical protein